MTISNLSGRAGIRRPLILAALLALPAAVLAIDPADAELIRKLSARVEQLEKEVGEIQGTAAAAPAAPDATYPKVHLSGFVDLNYRAGHRTGSAGHFEVGELDTFITSRISENASVIIENVIAADESNNFGDDIERLIFQYRFSDAFNLDIGRFHTALGYYNTAYHHGTWFQTATGRPGFLNYEDSGGIIPVHTVGASLHGALPSGKLNLTYFAEVGNGRQYRDPASGANPVANVSDNNHAKAFNFALVARPDGVPGLQFGAGYYHDLLTPDHQVRTEEQILHSHFVFRDASWEFLAEAFAIRHTPDHAAATNSRAWYTQLSRGFGPLRPYVRYSRSSVPLTDGPFALIGADGGRRTTSLGLRWDFIDFAAYKIQLDQIAQDGLPDASEVTLQLAITF